MYNNEQYQKLVDIHDLLLYTKKGKNNKKEQIIIKINEYGLINFWKHYLQFLEDIYYELESDYCEYFTSIVIIYHDKTDPYSYHNEPDYILAMMGLQSIRFHNDPDYRDAVSNVLSKYFSKKIK